MAQQLYKMKPFLLLISLTLVSQFNKANAQWSTDPAINTPVCTATANQREQRLLKDGKGGVYVVWKDYRTGVSDIYMQRFDAFGNPLWANNGVGICTNSADQSTPNIVTDMQGGAIVVWSDWRSSVERDVYAQRIDSNGNVLWMTDGMPVTTKTNREHTPKMVSDDAGGAIIVWEQQTSGMWDVWAQHLDANGNILWANGGIPLVTGVGTMNRRNHKIEKDGNGGAIIVWQDERSGTFDIYGQRLDAFGNLKWGSSGKVICNAIDVQNNPKIDPDSSTHGAYIAWVDKRSGNSDIYAQRIDSNGNPIWTPNGLAICSAVGTQSAVDIMSNSKTNGLYLAWKDNRSGNYDIYSQFVDAVGSPQWGTDGIVISNNPYDQQNPNLSNDGGTGLIVTWQDSSGNGFDVKAQKINNTGNLLWDATGALIATAVGDQYDPCLASDSKGGTIVAWTDKRAGTTSDIYIHHLYADGTTSSISELIKGKVTLGPNPFKNEFGLSFQLKKQEQISVVISDLLGRDMTNAFEITINQISDNAKVSAILKQVNLISGLYWVTIQSSTAKATFQLMKD